MRLIIAGIVAAVSLIVTATDFTQMGTMGHRTQCTATKGLQAGATATWP